MDSQSTQGVWDSSVAAVSGSEFQKLGIPYLGGVLILRILVFLVASLNPYLGGSFFQGS